ncbi:MAG: ABC transporter permease [Candidatus Bathyarchaeia archaeon]
MPDIFTVALKEFSDIVRGRRFIILVAVFGLLTTVAIASVYLTVIQSVQLPGSIAMPRGFLGMAGSMLAGTMSFFAPIMGLALGCDAISGEKERGTLKVTLAQPVYRDTIINGKFLAALFAVSLAVLITSVADIGGSVLVLGITPGGEDAARLMLFTLFAILFAMTYYGIAAFLSTVSKRTTQSVILGVVLWAVFTFVIPIIASLIAFMLMPMSFQFQNATSPSQEEMNRLVEEMRKRTAITEGVSSVTPNYHFGKISQYLLNPYATTGVAQPAQGPVSVAISLMNAAPNMLVLVMATVLVFVASYIVFTRQEVR